MKRLTKDERFTAYVIMLHECDTWSVSGGFCNIIKEVFDIEICKCYLFPFREFEKLFPELYAKRTTRGYVFLFKNWDERISALKECIKETS